MTNDITEAGEVSDEKIYADLKAYADVGMIDYVLPTTPLGEQWIVGWNRDLLKFVTKEGVVGFLTGIAVGVDFAVKKLRPGITLSAGLLATQQERNENACG